MQGSFEEFVRSRGPSLLRYAHLLTGDAGRAEDLVQDALVKLHARWETGTTAPHAYARRIVTNDYLSWRRRLSNSEAPSVIGDPATVGVPTDEVAERDAVWRAIRGLPRRQRVVIVLRYYEDLTDHDIAAVLGVADGTVRSLASRAFATLRTHPALGDSRAAKEPR